MTTSYRKTWSWFLSFLLLQVCQLVVNGDYRLEVRFHSYTNAMQVQNSGSCCDSVPIFGPFPPDCVVDECDTWFRFCLRESTAPRDSDPTNCLDSATQNSYESTTSINGNTLTPGDFTQSGVPNPLIFTGPSWPGSFQLLVETREASFCPLCVFFLIDDIYIVDHTLLPGQPLAQDTYDGTQTSISLSFSVTCTSMHGPNCDDLCPPLDPPANGRVVPNADPIIQGSTASYFCDTRYVIIGDATRECLQSGVWTGSEPICELGCGQLSNPTSGHVQFSCFTIGCIAEYTCNPGFILQGPDSRTCQNSGWIPTEPTCIRDCGPLSAPDKGQVVFLDTTEGSTATYSCDSGYRLNGPSTRTCSTSGQWSGSTPSCVMIRDCGPLSAPDKGQVDFTDTTEGSTATYSCDSGYRLNGPSTRTCSSSGQWSDSTPSCSEEADTAPSSREGSSNLPAIIAGSVIGVLVVVVVVGLAILILAIVMKKRSKFGNVPQSYNCKPDPRYNYRETTMEVPVMVTTTLQKEY